MAENRSILSPENQPTVIVVCVVLALLGTGFGIYDMLQIQSVSRMVQQVNNINVDAIQSQLTAATTRLDAMDKRLAEMDKRTAAMPAPADAAAAAAAAPEGKAGKQKAP